MTEAIVVAVISGVVSLAAAAIALYSSRSVTRLSSELEERRRLTDKREQAEELRARYRDPLLTAVFDLQSRLYNIVAKAFLVRYMGQDRHSREYAIDNTLHLLAEYLAWVEIIRREIQFLDLGGELANRRWVNVLEDVRDVLARDDLDPALRIFRGEQRAIGEAATVTPTNSADQKRGQSLGYARFVICRRDADFDRWFEKLQADLELLAAEPDLHLERLIMLQNRLIDVLEIFDPDCQRFPVDRRLRLTTAEPAVQVALDSAGPSPRSSP